MFAANSSIQHNKEKTDQILGTWRQYLVNVSGLRYSKKKEGISRRIDEFSDNLTSLSIFTSNIKQFLWKYHILYQPFNIWTAF